MSVRDVRAKTWPIRSCLAIVGRLSAAEGPICNKRPAHEASFPSGGTQGEFHRCAPEWVFTDLSDPIILLVAQSSPPFIRLMGTNPRMPGVPALLACNRGDNAQAIMPPTTRFGLPPGLHVNDLPRINAGLSGLTVGIFGGQAVPDYMTNVPETFDSMVVTHICRVEAPDAGD